LLIGYTQLRVSDKVDRSEQAESEVVIKTEIVPQIFYYPGKETAIQPPGWVEVAGSVRLWAECKALMIEFQLQIARWYHYTIRMEGNDLDEGTKSLARRPSVRVPPS